MPLLIDVPFATRIRLFPIQRRLIDAQRRKTQPAAASTHHHLPKTRLVLISLARERAKRARAVVRARRRRRAQAEFGIRNSELTAQGRELPTGSSHPRLGAIPETRTGTTVGGRDARRTSSRGPRGGVRWRPETGARSRPIAGRSRSPKARRAMSTEGAAPTSGLRHHQHRPARPE